MRNFTEMVFDVCVNKSFCSFLGEITIFPPIFSTLASVNDKPQSNYL